jgi:hypothetical protein
VWNSNPPNEQNTANLANPAPNSHPIPATNRPAAQEFRPPEVLVVLPSLHPLHVLSLLHQSLLINIREELLNFNLDVVSRRVIYLQAAEQMIREIAV